MIVSVGWRYETVRESLDAKAYPMPGQLVDVGGHRLHLHCTGSGSPTVVLEPGGGAASSDLGWIAPAVARDTRVCVYDRAGRGPGATTSLKYRARGCTPLPTGTPTPASSQARLR
jgi:pimeloyl-ACP methyl ester carboxylesterase